MDMMASSALREKNRRLEQQLHREQLKLARLKRQTNRARQADTRMKVRLGGLLYLLDWHTLTEAKLDNRIKQVATTLADINDYETVRTVGENAFRRLEQEKESEMTPEKLSPEKRRSLNHHKITLGGLLVKHGLHDYPRSVLFGALLECNKSLMANQALVGHRVKS
jgi:hypothetical protein